MNFETAIDHILKFEGGYVNDAKDPGGETNFGISKRQYPHLEIKSLNRAAAISIYRRDYWDAVGIDKLPKKLRLIVFDASVNHGASAAVVMLQNCVGTSPDGIIGERTLSAISKWNPDDLLAVYIRERLHRYFSTTNFDRFGRGWITRLISVSITSSTSIA